MPVADIGSVAAGRIAEMEGAEHSRALCGSLWPADADHRVAPPAAPPQGAEPHMHAADDSV